MRDSSAIKFQIIVVKVARIGINESLLTAKQCPCFNEPHETDSLKVIHMNFCRGRLEMYQAFKSIL